MGRSPCCEKNGLKKGPWTSEEDQKLLDYIKKHGYAYGPPTTFPLNSTDVKKSVEFAELSNPKRYTTVICICRQRSHGSSEFGRKYRWNSRL
ncbi:hypothetical protein Bca52824_038166 [Brassica carinata]|uniref:HTH myb-type domain-containing protein n=1 Tax=Brassica carinata TaxID=52824 RepID=A0A8X7UUN4_BRACI|nr:hypothetical protein Bca52824_038166 [Brassica carinata]